MAQKGETGMDLVKLVQSAQRNDAAAFEVLFDRFNVMALGYAYSLLGDAEAAEDVVQESAIDVFCNIHKLRIPQSFPSWFKRIIQYNSSAHWRHPPLKWVRLDDMDQICAIDTPPEDQLEKKELRESVRKFIDCLSRPVREVTILFYLKEYSLAEIAEFLCIPQNTVKTRLYSARKHLKHSMEYAMTDYLNERIPKDIQYAHLIQNVPALNRDSPGQRLWEDVPLCSCLRSTLDTIGDQWGIGHEIMNGKDWEYSRSYTYLMGTTGLAFRFTWSKKWDIEIVSSYTIGETAETVFNRAYNAIGYSYTILRTKYPEREKTLTGKEKDELHLEALALIKKSIDAGVPVIAHGVIGPPEECLITGYEENGEVLTGWNMFQKADFSHPSWYGAIGDGQMEKITDIEVSYTPSGYFRKHNWFNNTWSVMYITGKKQRPDQKIQFMDTLSWALKVIRSETSFWEKFDNGIRAYESFAESLEKLKSSDSDSNRLRSRYIVFISAVAMIIENRTYARLFLKEIGNAIPCIAGKMEQMRSLYERELEKIWCIWNLLEIRKEDFSAWPSVNRRHDEHRSIERFSDREVRLQCARIIRDSAEYEKKVAEILEEVCRES